MPRSSRRTRKKVEEEDEGDNLQVEEDEEEEEEADDDDDDDDEEEEAPQPSPRKKSRRSRVVVEENEDEEEEEEDHKHPNTLGTLTLSSQAPESTQEILPVRENERNKFLNLNEDVREKAVSDVLRLVLFKALSGDTIDRLKIAKEAQISDAKVTGAVFEEVNVRLENLFAFKLKRVPAYMEKVKDFPAKCKDRYYLVNTAPDHASNHLKSMYALHTPTSIEKGLLMVILGFIFCKGNSRSDGSRWLLDKELYRLLHMVDENLPPEPPATGTQRSSHKVEGSPDVDAVLERFVKMDFLFRLKANEQFMTMNDQAEETSFFYAMGSRSVVTIGRLQVLHFIGQSLGEEVSEEMLAEIQNEDEE